MNTTAKLEIEQIKIERPHDDDFGMLSDLGKYTDDADPWVIVRAENEYLNILQNNIEREQGEDVIYDLPPKGREVRFFKPFAGGAKPGSEDYINYGRQDYERAEAYNNGQWSYCGVVAHAFIKVNDSLQEITSAGIYGVESDSSKDSFKELEAEQLSELKDILLALGFTEEQIDEAMP